MGLRWDATGALSPAPPLPPAGDLPPSGHQAGRCGAGDGPAPGPVQRRGAAADLRLLRPAHHRRLVTVGVHPGHRRRGRRQVPDGRGVPGRCRRGRHGRHRGNLRDGLHVASAGGAWMAVVYGFAGYRWRTGTPEFAPILPTRGQPRPLPAAAPRVGPRGRHRGAPGHVRAQERRAADRLPLRPGVHCRCRCPSRLPRPIPHAGRGSPGRHSGDGHDRTVRGGRPDAASA